MSELRRTRYRTVPLSVLRHLWLSELPDAPAELPQSLAQRHVLSYDPLPPQDSRSAYTRPVRQLRLEHSTNTLGNFLLSFLPNFDPNAPLDRNATSNEGGLLRAMVTAMRDFVRDIRPASVPLENELEPEEEPPAPG